MYEPAPVVETATARAGCLAPPYPPKTPLIEIVPGLLAKLECNNPGGSHKTRAARRIVAQAVADGRIIPGKTTVIEKTGGNFGFGLLWACAGLDVRVELAVGLSFSPVKRACLAAFGADLVGVSQLQAGGTPREVVEARLAAGAAADIPLFYTDQFANPAGLAAHEEETGPEIAEQLARRPEIRRVTFVAGAGTGASLTGVARSLRRAGYQLRVVLVEPQGADAARGVHVDHRMEGVSVGVAPPFLDWSLVDARREVSFEEMTVTRRETARRSGYYVGNSAAACLAAARDFVDGRRDHAVLTIIYDHGLWYQEAIQ